MTRADAISLVQQYAEQRPDPDICRLAANIGNPDHSEAKCMRWLGFVQGFLYGRQFYSIEELKQHSRMRQVP